MSQSEKIQQWALDNNLKLSYIFVPFSVSRNRQEKLKSLNYIVSLQSDKNVLSTDYMKGQGHLQIELTGKSNCHISVQKRDLQREINEACEIGRYKSYAFQDVRISRVNGKSAAFPVPSIDEVLFALNCDSDVNNYSDFTDWADCMGYDSDSITAKNIYDACQKIAKDFNKLLTASQRTELAELLQDY